VLKKSFTKRLHIAVYWYVPEGVSLTKFPVLSNQTGLYAKNRHVVQIARHICSDHLEEDTKNWATRETLIDSSPKNHLLKKREFRSA